MTRHRHGKKVKVKTRPRHKIVKVTKCHPKTKRVRVVVRVPLRRHGKVVQTPRQGRVPQEDQAQAGARSRRTGSHKTNEHVRHGHATTVSGWLGLTDGTALGGQTVQVLTAPDNGLGQFTAVAATATTAAERHLDRDAAGRPIADRRGLLRRRADDRSDRLRPGQAGRSGQGQAQSVTPHRVAWGQTVRIKGKLLGGYLPAGGVNVRLRIGIKGRQDHLRRHEARVRQRPVQDHLHVRRGSEHPIRYWFQIATLPSGNYPYTPSSSNRIYVDVGGHPPALLPLRLVSNMPGSLEP